MSYNSNTIIKNIDNAIKSLEIETTQEGSYIKVKDLLGRSKYISDKGLVDKISDANVIGGVDPSVIQNIENISVQVNEDKIQTGLDRQQVEHVRDEVSESSRITVPTRAAIDALVEAGKPRLFEVAVDETLGDQQLVPYRWNGSVLFMYDIYPSTTQPVM